MLLQIQPLCLYSFYFTPVKLAHQLANCRVVVCHANRLHRIDHIHYHPQLPPCRPIYGDGMSATRRNRYYVVPVVYITLVGRLACCCVDEIICTSTFLYISSFLPSWQTSHHQSNLTIRLQNQMASCTPSVYRGCSRPFYISWKYLSDNKSIESHRLQSLRRVFRFFQ